MMVAQRPHETVFVNKREECFCLLISYPFIGISVENVL